MNKNKNKLSLISLAAAYTDGMDVHSLLKAGYELDVVHDRDFTWDTSCEKLVPASMGGATLVRVSVGGTCTVAEALCSKTDRYNKAYGRRLGLARLVDGIRGTGSESFNATLKVFEKEEADHKAANAKKRNAYEIRMSKEWAPLRSAALAKIAARSPKALSTTSKTKKKSSKKK